MVGVADMRVPARASLRTLDALLDDARDGAVRKIKAKPTAGTDVWLNG